MFRLLSRLATRSVAVVRSHAKRGNEANEDGSLRPRRNWVRSLRHRNFRRFFLGQGVSLVGTWMQQTALAWLVYRLTENPFLQGVNNFANQIPSLLLLPLAGVLVDRWNRLRLVRITQTLAMLQAFLLAALVFWDIIEIWQLMLLSFVLGSINAFDMPARQAMLPQMLESKEDLSNAIALNSSLFNGARLVGPAVAGLMAGLGRTGEAWCFLLNGISFLAVLLSLATIHLAKTPQAAQPRAVLEGLREGLNYVRGHRPIRAILVLTAAVGFFAMPYAVLLPQFAGQVLGGGAASYGLLLTASGCGALAGGVYLAARSTMRGSASRIVVTGVLLAASLAAFALSNDFTLSMVLVLAVGANMMLTMVTCNTIVQNIVPDDKRGRIMSLYSLAFLGLTPFGGLIVGGVAQWWGPTVAMLGAAAGCLLGAVLFLPALPAVRAAIRAHVDSLKAPPAPAVELSGEVSGV
jgi:MFS family permease